MLGALLMHYPKKAKRWVLAGVPLCTLSQGVQIYLVNKHGARAAKALVGVGRGLYQITVRVCIQAVVARNFLVGTTERQAIDLSYRETQQLLAIAAMIIIMWFVKNFDLLQTQGSSIPQEGGEGLDKINNDGVGEVESRHC